MNLIQRLPEDSHTRSVLTWGEKYEGWSTERLIDALSLEQQIFSRHDFQQANSEKKVKAPKELDLPGRKEQKQQSNPFARMLAEAKAHEARS